MTTSVRRPSRRRFILPLLLALGLGTLFTSCGSSGARPRADQPYESTTARYLPGPDQAVLQTPCYRFTDSRGRRVELTGAIHIAEKSYYQDLNKHLRSFDAVLYEGVGSPRPKTKPQTKKPAPAAAATGPATPARESEVSQLYRTLSRDFLHMPLQAEEIDYTRPNFIHADVSRQEFESLLQQHGMTLDSVVKTNRFSPGLRTTRWMLGLMRHLLPTGDPDAMKRMSAPSLARAEENSLSGPAYQVIIVERDRHLLQVLDRELAAGKRNISLFYGSGHFPDLQKQLRARGWRPTGTQWRTAWTIPAEKRG